MQHLLGLLGTILIAWAIGWLLNKVLRGFKEQSSSIKTLDINSLQGREIKVYRRGLPQLPYGKVRPRVKSASTIEDQSGSYAQEDITIMVKTAEYFDKAEEYSSIGYFEKAIEQLQLALALEPGNVEVYEAMGDLYMALVAHEEPLENLEAAIKCYQNAIAVMPKAGGNHYKLGVALERRGLKTEAMLHLKTAKEIGFTKESMDLLISQLDKRLDD